MNYPDLFDVVVIGCGHAGAEAALASARMGGEDSSDHAQYGYHRTVVVQPVYWRHR